MKRVLSIALLVTMVILYTSAVMAADKITISLNGTTIAFPDAQPFIDKNGRTQVPIAALAQILNVETEWDGNTKTAYIKKDNAKVKITIGDNKIYINDTETIMDTAAIIVNDRTFVPIRYVAEVFNFDVKWDESTNSINMIPIENGVNKPLSNGQPAGQAKVLLDMLNYNTFRANDASKAGWRGSLVNNLTGSSNVTARPLTGLGYSSTDVSLTSADKGYTLSWGNSDLFAAYYFSSWGWSESVYNFSTPVSIPINSTIHFDLETSKTGDYKMIATYVLDTGVKGLFTIGQNDAGYELTNYIYTANDKADGGEVTSVKGGSSDKFPDSLLNRSNSAESAARFLAHNTHHVGNVDLSPIFSQADTEATSAFIYMMGFIKSTASGENQSITIRSLNITGVPSASPIPSLDTDAKADSMRERIRSTSDALTYSGAAYYVSNKGNDKNTGLSPTEAWASIDKVNAQEFAVGDAVLFERNGIYRGFLKTKSNVSYGAYGSGAKPGLYGSLINYTTAKWTNAEGNVWYCPTKATTDIGIIVFDEGDKVGVKKLTKSLSSDFDFYHDIAANRVYVYSSKGDPSSLFKSIEMGEKKHVVSVYANDVTIDNLCVKYGGAHGIGGATFRNVKITNCEVGWIGGSIQFDNDITRYGNAIECWESCDNFTVKNCYIYQAFDAGITHQGQSAYTVNKNILYEDNLIEYCCYSIEYFEHDPTAMMSNIVIQNNLLRYSGYGWGNQRTTNVGISAHIKSWYAPNQAEKFIIRNNILDTGLDNIVEIWANAGSSSLPSMSGNIYQQTKGYRAGAWNGEPLRYYLNIAARMAQCGMEDNATIYMN